MNLQDPLDIALRGEPNPCAPLDYDSEPAELAPDLNAIKAHLEYMFGGDLGTFADGKIEIAWTSVKDGIHKLNKAQLFNTDQIDIAAKLAAAKNECGSNVYCGVWLRKPDTFPGARASAENCYATFAVCCDLDKEGRAQNAKHVWAGLPPTHVILTGNAPHARMQFYYLLTEPVTDHVTYSAAQAALVAAFDGDPEHHRPAASDALARLYCMAHQTGPRCRDDAHSRTEEKRQAHRPRANRGQI